MLPASGVQLARHHVQQHRCGRVDLWLGDLPGAAQRALSFVELSHPDRPEGNRPKRRREYRPIAQAIAFRQGDRLTPPFARARERDNRCRENLVSATRDLEVWPADRLGERGALGKVPLGIVESPRPRLDDPEIHQRDSPQLTAHRDRLARFARDRSVKHVQLLDHLGELTAAACQRQPQRRDGHRRGAGGGRAGRSGRGTRPVPAEQRLPPTGRVRAQPPRERAPGPDDRLTPRPGRTAAARRSCPPARRASN